MSDALEALPAHNAQGGAGLCVQYDINVDAGVSGHCLSTERICSTFGNSMKLCLPLDKDTTVWVEAQCFTQCPPSMTAPPLVLRLVAAQPTKSVSIGKPICAGTCCHM